MKRYDICADYSQSYAEECDDGEWVEADIAVELLDALEDLIDQVNRYYPTARISLKDAEEAISKAKGENCE